MKKIRSTIVFVILLVFANTAFAQLTIAQENDLQDFLTNNNELTQENVIDIICEPIDDIYNLQCPKYQDIVAATGTNDYTTAIRQAITDATANGGGVILFPGNTTVEITGSIEMKSNITFRASHSKATIKHRDSDFSGSQLIVISYSVSPVRENITFENMIFDGNNHVSGIISYGTEQKNINVLNCEFQNTKRSNTFGSGISLKDVTDVNIKNCAFRESNFGISLENRNSRIRIENNKFEKSLTKNPIRIQGQTDGDFFSDHVWILNNDIRIQEAPSIINEHDSLVRQANGVVTGLSLINGRNLGDSNYNLQYTTWKLERKGPSAIYITCSNQANESGKNFHENIVVENNIAIGPDLSFFNGGSADLYSLKDIVRLKCNGNVARNSGDLGFALERCSGVVATGNTADRNNSFGIGLLHTRNSIINDNIVDNNSLRRDYMYNSTPYGGIVVYGKSYNNLIEGNHLHAYSAIDVSFPVTESYTNRTNPSDYYGIVFRAEFDDDAGGFTSDSPTSNKIGVNHYGGQRWGPIYTQTPSTQIAENFSAATFPKDRDYPLGTWIRNSNLINSALGWSVVNRVETKLHVDWNVGDAHIKVVDDSNSIQVGDIFGVMLDDGSIHWSEIDELIPQIGHYKVGLLQNPTVNISNAGIVDPAPSTTQTVYNGMDRVVILRWLTVTK